MVSSDISLTYAPLMVVSVSLNDGFLCSVRVSHCTMRRDAQSDGTLELKKLSTNLATRSANFDIVMVSRAAFRSTTCLLNSGYPSHCERRFIKDASSLCNGQTDLQAKVGVGVIRHGCMLPGRKYVEGSPGSSIENLRQANSNAPIRMDKEHRR